MFTVYKSTKILTFSQKVLFQREALVFLGRSKISKSTQNSGEKFSSEIVKTNKYVQLHYANHSNVLFKYENIIIVAQVQQY